MRRWPRMVSKDLEERCHGLFEDTVSEFGWEHWEKPWNTTLDSCCPDRELNLIPPEYRWLASPTEHFGVDYPLYLNRWRRPIYPPNLSFMDVYLLQMFRPVLLLAAVVISAWCDVPPHYPNLDRCASIFCAGVNEEDCPGEYLAYHPPERCCSVCTVYKGEYIIRVTSFRTFHPDNILACWC
jgi:hypothetical protein